MVRKRLDQLRLVLLLGFRCDCVFSCLSLEWKNYVLFLHSFPKRSSSVSRSRASWKFKWRSGPLKKQDLCSQAAALWLESFCAVEGNLSLEDLWCRHMADEAVLSNVQFRTNINCMHVILLLAGQEFFRIYHDYSTHVSTTQNFKSTGRVARYQPYCQRSSFAAKHGLEVRNEQLGFRPDRSAQPWWALDLFGGWSPRTWLWPNGIQLYGLLPWCSGSTSLWPLPAIHFTRDGAPRWRSSLGPIWPVTPGNTAPKDECELPQGGGREEGRRVSANRRKYNGTTPIVDPSRHCQNCSDYFGAWNWPNMTWLVPVAVRECDSC